MCLAVGRVYERKRNRGAGNTPSPYLCGCGVGATLKNIFFIFLMIDNETIEQQGIIFFILRKGCMVWQREGVDMYCTEIEGTFKGIEAITHKGHRYWVMRLQDETNTLSLLFVYRSAVFKNLVLTLCGERFSYLNIESAYDEDEQRNKLRIYVDAKRVYPQYIPLPPIKRKKDKVTGKIYCDYTARMKRITEMVEQINISNARVMG